MSPKCGAYHIAHVGPRFKGCGRESKGAESADTTFRQMHLV